MDRLYSGVTNTRPSAAADLFLEALHGFGRRGIVVLIVKG